MPRHHTTSSGNVQFTAAEEAEYDIQEQEWSDGAAARTMANIRQERDGLLAATDWWGASDNTMTDARTAYRLALRNYPATFTADNSSAWPTKP